tara:strand:- start:60 stop:530 length:471 start_codon:yes stop_codon:yes gene_type:complete
MKNKKLLKTLIFILIVGCGYTPILVDKDYPFKIKKIEKIGSQKVNSNIILKLKNLRKNKDDNINQVIYNLKLDSETEKKIISKDSKGDPLIFEIKITTIVTVYKDNNEKILSQKISNKIKYDNQTDKFELIKYENNLIYNLSSNLGDKILSILSNI